MINQELVINLIELRKRIIYILIGLLIVFIPLFKFANQLYDILAKPLLRYMPVGTQLSDSFTLEMWATMQESQLSDEEE